ncbi:hypothetical protein DPEC_G00207870 [Dallia pectoralis]|uniref:Uncharacterized protein n=1 Tax=Dallia pectoralis TaxID=75939 RepID=A0ACC2G553_DALPE|nr:hypothetical protein DPEC_G00207870 [Dallia pectoralis]
MERDRGFNFKLLVPPRVLPLQGQVSTVKPQEMVEHSECATHSLPQQQGYRKCFEKELNKPFSSTNMFVPAKSTRSDVFQTKGVSQMENEETKCQNSQLYSKLFEEVQKVKCWKVKVESEAVQKERKLQENKRTIETQRKAIQELQFENESLSIKLEDQISENEDLQNKNNATRNLCNILKDAFEKSSEKINSFESEREETHHLFMDNSESIQRLIAAFESLCIQAETDRHEMLKVKEGLQEFEGLKEKCEKEFSMKQEEVVMLQMKINDKEKELQQVLLNFHEIQESFKQLQEEARQHQEALQSSKQEQQSILESLQRAEQFKKECEESRKAVLTEFELNKEDNAKVIAEKDALLEEIMKLKEQIQATSQEFQTLLTVEKQRAKENEMQLTLVTKGLEREINEFEEKTKNKDSQLQMLEDELDVKTKAIESLVEKNKDFENKTSELTAKLEGKYAEIVKLKNKVLTMSLENNVLEKALKKAEQTQTDMKEQANMTESKIQEIECQLLAAIRREETSVKNVEKLKTVIVQHEVKYEELSASFIQLKLEKQNILEQIQNDSSEATILAAQLKESEAKEIKLKNAINSIEEERHVLQEKLKSINARIEEQGQDTDNELTLLTERCEDLQTELSKKEKQMKAVETKLYNLTIKLESKTKVQEEYKKENKTLKKQIAFGTAKSSELENEINTLKEKSEDLQRSNEAECKRLLDDLETKLTSEADLHRKIQNLQLTATEALDNKEDAEIKCQNKIADMVALMEKHKKQYDKMVEEKDAEVNEKKKKDMEAVANRTSMEFELSQKNIENDHFREQLEKEIKERECLLQEIKDLKKEVKSLKLETQDKQLSEPKSKEVRCNETPEVSTIMWPVSRFAKDTQKKTRTPKASETLLQCSDRKVAVTPVMNEIENEGQKTPSWRPITRVAAAPQKETKSKTPKTPSWHSTSTVSTTPRIKSYRIRTPPSLEKSVPWGKSTLELDPKSDSSEHNDLLSFAMANEPSRSNLQPNVPAAQHHKVDLFRKIQSPAIHKSPGSALKLAAMKRMRDAGWTAVTSADKKKRAVEKIFA